MVLDFSQKKNNTLFSHFLLGFHLAELLFTLVLATKKESMPQVIEKTITQETPYAVVTESKVEDTSSQTAMYLTYFISGVLETMLLFRFMFKLTGANPSSGFVSFIYGLTQMLILPFRGIFPVATTEGAVAMGVFEPQTIVVMVVYSVLAWGVVQFIGILSRQSA